MDRDGEDRLANTGSWVGLPGLRAGPVDHAWLDNGHRVLSCVAGHRHPPSAVAVCPFYLRCDVVDTIPNHLRADRGLPVAVWYRERPYFKVTGLVGPEHWHELVASLPACHGLRPCAWSVLSVQDPGCVVAGYDPRDALRTLLARPDPGTTVDLLARLVAGLGDAGNEHGSVGITGSIALAPEPVGQANDADLLLYLPADRRSEFDDVMCSLGAAFLRDLVADGDPRLDSYPQSRVSAPVCRPTSRAVFWSRRRDVAWIGEQRIDLTWAEPDAVLIGRLPYDLEPAGTFHGELRVRSVTDQFPVLAAIDGRDGITELRITAGDFKSLLPGDLLTVAGNLHDSHNRERPLSRW